MTKPIDASFYPVTIVGGGVTGLFLALALARSHCSVLLLEAKPYIVAENAITSAARVSALHAVSLRMLERLQVSPLLHPTKVSPLLKLKVWDQVTGAEINFDSADLGATALGAIVDNANLLNALWQVVQSQPLITVKTGVVLQSQEMLASALALRITDAMGVAQTVETQLLVGADGRDSWVRQQIPMATSMVEQSQTALIAVIASEKSHQCVARQVFAREGIVALLPLADRHHEALVWSMSNSAAKNWCQQTTLDFDAYLNRIFGARLGVLQTISELQALPLWLQHAHQYVAPRLALIGDAAHSVHPLAGQGVNLGLMDAAFLADVINKAREKQKDVGELGVLNRYARLCRFDNELMTKTIAGVAQCFSVENKCFSTLRTAGMQLVERLTVIKKQLMRTAMGLRRDLPSLAGVLKD